MAGRSKKKVCLALIIVTCYLGKKKCIQIYIFIFMKTIYIIISDKAVISNEFTLNILRQHAGFPESTNYKV